jgi:hypothetical protein|tara:strand:+ start:1492 stop:1995 length:504 start_codon:yes stop_codon:yes gene_type:complete
MKYIGIDPGTKGGFVVLDSKGEVEDWLVMPMIGKEYDVRIIVDFLTKHKDSHIFIENVKAVSGLPVSSTSSFNFGFGVGLLNGIIYALEIPFTKVAVPVWQKTMWEGVAPQKKTNGKKDTKTMSTIAARRLFPTQTFLATQRSSVPHEGLIDGALIAKHGYRSLTKK